MTQTAVPMDWPTAFATVGTAWAGVVAFAIFFGFAATGGDFLEHVAKIVRAARGGKDGR